MNFCIFVVTSAIVTEAFSLSPSGIGIGTHHNLKVGLGGKYVTFPANRTPFSFQTVVQGSGSILIPLPINNKFFGMSSSESDEEAINSSKEDNMEVNDNDSEYLAKIVAWRKERIVVGYTCTSGLYLCNVVQNILILLKGQTAVSRIAYFSCGSVLASGLAYIQKGAAEHDRLRSDTYKRLNLFMAWHGFLMVVVSSLVFKSAPFFIIMNFVAMMVSIKGYAYGARGWTLKEGVPFVEDLVQGVKGTFQGMIVGPSRNTQSVGYFLGTAVASALKIFKSMEIVKLLIESGGIISFTVGTRLFRCSKLGLLSVCMYSLKDAADRDRLSGTTFIQLNFLCSLVWASLASYIYQQIGTLWPSIMATLAGILALFTAGNGYMSILEKKNA